MASTFHKLPSRHHANPRAVLKTKLSNEVSVRSNVARSSAQVVGGMSPEARAAMLLTREDTNDGFARYRHTSLPRTNTNLTAIKRDKIAAGNSSIRKLEPLAPIPPSHPTLKPSTASDSGSRERSKPAASTSDFNDSGFSSITRHPLSAATANTIADAEEKFETDSNNNNSMNASNRQQRQHRPVSRKSQRQSASRESLDERISPGRTLSNAKVSASGRNVEDCPCSPSQNTVTSKSFVMALDAALEANCISRLRGDITDVTEGSGAAPGTVRALNGGRLSNAQEVVVNVCHGECEKELVFHDDDDDSLDTARAASEIRVNTWLEYNQDFPPDEVDFDYDTDSNFNLRPDIAAAQTTKPLKTTLRVPTARLRSSGKQTNQNQTLSSVSGSRGGKPPVPCTNRRDNNNNNNNNKNSNITTTTNNNGSVGSARSKSGTTASQKDNCSSRFGSAMSNDGSSKQSANSSARKQWTVQKRERDGVCAWNQGDGFASYRHTSLPRTDTNLTVIKRDKIAAGYSNIRKLEPLAPLPPSHPNLKPSTASDSGSRERSKPAASTSDFNDSGFSSITRHPLSAATANTIADAEEKFETDSNNNNSMNASNRQQRQHRPVSRKSQRQSASRESLDERISPGRTLSNAKVSASGRNVEDCPCSPSQNTVTSKSFVIALDATLESNCISRLRGDITDVTKCSGAALGTVPALNSRRLSNAQEVVVNVCHGECEKELVFHDDDDDSLDTARAASEKRITTWLKYNQDFPPEELDYD
ncbi:hypothetical protein ElyMa_006808400 [Elysia marginata]|uniref:Uncharacterized protein n=1 Tax=Elysia marginata TaxID=1093978 RepID=A0AAV4J4I9_9GAST|nr:hypothetical protein ElyMa_006808400 [Elysia marginata]